MRLPGKFYLWVLGLLNLLCKPFASHAQEHPLNAKHDTAIHFMSPIMGEVRTLWIHLPPDYDGSRESYPVLYLLDGDMHFDYAAPMVDFLSGYDRNRIPEMIVVGIVNVDRGRDFTPVYANNGNGSPDSSKILTDAGAGRFLRYLSNEVVPYVDTHYRVQPYRVLAAHSLGGLFALYAKESRPDLFPAMIMTSPVIDYRMLGHFDTFLDVSHPHNGKLYLGIGDEDLVKFNAFVAKLKQQAPAWFDWTNMQYPGENHFTAPYKTLFDGLKFIYRDWFIDHYGHESFVLEDIDARFKKLSSELGYHIVPPEDYLNDCGYDQLRLKYWDNAIGIFAENVKRHPDSWNAYDSLGEAYMDAGNKALAIKNYEKSLALNPHNDDGRKMLEKLKK